MTLAAGGKFMEATQWGHFTNTHVPVKHVPYISSMWKHMKKWCIH